MLANPHRSTTYGYRPASDATRAAAIALTTSAGTGTPTYPPQPCSSPSATPESTYPSSGSAKANDSTRSPQPPRAPSPRLSGPTPKHCCPTPLTGWSRRHDHHRPTAHHETAHHDQQPIVRLGILGAAGIAPQAVIRPAQRRRDVTVHGVASRRPETARAYAAAHGIPVSYDSYDALLEADDIDVVYVALPPSEHARWAAAALQAGKHVLCEKPITLNAGEAAQLEETAQSTGKHVIEAFHDHYHPLTTHLHDLRRSAPIGTLTSIATAFTADNPYFPGSIRHTPALGGGALMDLGCYPVHWLRTFMGTEPEVHAAHYVAGPEGADMTIDAELAFGDVVATMHASMAPGVPFAAPFSAQGTRGSFTITNLVLPHNGHSVTTLIDGVTSTYTLAGRETYDYQLDALVHTVRTDEPAATEGPDFVPNMAVIDAIYRKAGATHITQ